MTNNKTLHNFIRGGVNLKLSILVIVALIAMMFVACKNKVTGMNEFTIESEEITAPSTPSTSTEIKDTEGVNQFSSYTYQSGTNEYRSRDGSSTIQVYYTASISGDTITIKVFNTDGSRYNNGQMGGRDQIFTATGSGAKYDLKAKEIYSMYIGGKEVTYNAGEATFDSTGYLTIKFNWSAGSIKLSTQSK